MMVSSLTVDIAAALPLATFLAVVVGLLEAFRRMGRERKADRNEVIREVVEQVLRETNPKLDIAVHELTNNGGNSQKDKVDAMLKEMAQLRNDMRTLTAKTDKISTQGDFWAKECVQQSRALATMSERVAVVEVATNKKGAKRWRFVTE